MVLYIQDTTNFLKKCGGYFHYPKGNILVTLDVSLLCTNIPYHEQITACDEALNWRVLLVSPRANLCHLLKLILSMNAFAFDNEHYLQLRGTAVST